MSDKPKVKYVCSDCGSDNVQISGWLDWDIDRQEWVFDQWCEGPTKPFCQECEDHNWLDPVQLTTESV